MIVGEPTSNYPLVGHKGSVKFHARFKGVSAHGSMPHLGESTHSDERKRLMELPGRVPSLTGELRGCLFAPRCPNAIARCAAEVPPLNAHGEAHRAACWNPVP